LARFCCWLQAWGQFVAGHGHRPGTLSTRFIAITLGLLALAYYKMFWRKADCESCSRGQKMVFWGIAVLSLLMLAVPWFM